MPATPCERLASSRRWSNGWSARRHALGGALAVLAMIPASTVAAGTVLERSDPATTCSRAVAHAGKRLVEVYVARLAQCLDALERCADGSGSGSCRDRARRACDRALERVREASARAGARIDGACATLPRDDLISSERLGFASVIAQCTGVTGGEPDGGLDLVRECVLRQHLCHAFSLLEILRPGGHQEMARRGVSVDGLACLADEESRAAAALAADDGSVPARCARGIEKHLRLLFGRRLAALQRCATGLLRCALGESDDPACAERARAACARDRARFDRRGSHGLAPWERACPLGSAGARALPPGADTSCVDLGVDAPASLGDDVACLSRRVECDAAALLRYEIPRGHALIATEDERLLGEHCERGLPPTPAPTPGLQGAGTPPPAGSAGAGSTSTPRRTPSATSTPSPTASATRTTTPTPTATRTPSCAGHALAIAPGAPGAIYLGLPGRGVFKSTSGGSSWSQTGFLGTTVHALAIDPRAPMVVYAGTETQGVVRSTSGGTVWEVTGLFAFAGAGSVRALVLDPQASSAVYAGTRGAGVAKSASGGQVWELTGLFAFPGGTHVKALAIDPVVPSVVYAGTATAGVFKTSSRGGSWSFTGLANLLDGDDVSALVVDAVSPTNVYAGTPAGDVFKSTSSGSTWMQTNFRAFVGGPVAALAVDPTTSGTLYAASGSEVSRSTSGGAAWQQTSFRATAGGALACALAIDPEAPATLYALTSQGRVFKSTNAGTSWQERSAGL